MGGKRIHRAAKVPSSAEPLRVKGRMRGIHFYRKCCAVSATAIQVGREWLASDDRTRRDHRIDCRWSHFQTHRPP